MVLRILSRSLFLLRHFCRVGSYFDGLTSGDNTITSGSGAAASAGGLAVLSISASVLCCSTGGSEISILFFSVSGTGADTDEIASVTVITTGRGRGWGPTPVDVISPLNSAPSFFFSPVSGTEGDDGRSSISFFIVWVGGGSGLELELGNPPQIPAMPRELSPHFHFVSLIFS